MLSASSPSHVPVLHFEEESIFATVSAGTTVCPDHPLAVKTGKVAGDVFQVLYYTTLTTSAEDPTAAFYNAVAQTDAANHGFGDISWTAIVTTLNDQRAPINSPQTAEIVLSDGTFFRNPDTLYTWNNPGSPPVKDINGVSSQGNNIFAWTGFNVYNGLGVTEDSPSPLGGPSNPWAGVASATADPSWAAITRLDPATTQRPLYALSEDITVQSCSGPDPGMTGDPHVKTWTSSYFDYHGMCDLVLVHAPNFDGNGNDLTIHVRTTIRYEYSYISAAAVRIAEDIFEVASFGDFVVNGVDTPSLDGYAGRLGNEFEIHHTEVNEKRHIFEVVLSPKVNITMGTFKDLVSVSIKTADQDTSAKYFGNSVGIMGSYKGQLLARDGVTVMEDMNAFGQEWQVTNQEPMLFRSTRAPQYPSKCTLPGAKKVASQRRLGSSIAKEAAKDACAHVSGAAFDNCVADVMVTGDSEVSTTYN